MHSYLTDIVGVSMPSGPLKDRQIWFRVSESEMKVIQEIADEEGRSVSAWVRWIVTNHLKEMGILPTSSATKKATKKKE